MKRVFFYSGANKTIYFEDLPTDGFLLKGYIVHGGDSEIIQSPTFEKALGIAVEFDRNVSPDTEIIPYRPGFYEKPPSVGDWVIMVPDGIVKITQVWTKDDVIAKFPGDTEREQAGRKIYGDGAVFARTPDGEYQNTAVIGTDLYNCATHALESDIEQYVVKKGYQR